VAVAKSIVAVSWVHAAVALAGTFLNMYVAAQMLELPLRDLGNAIFPALMSGLVMAVAVLSFLFLIPDAVSWMQLVGGILVGGLTYIASLWVFQREVVSDAIQIFQGVLKKG
jgi:hypothetical protein